PLLPRRDKGPRPELLLPRLRNLRICALGDLLTNPFHALPSADGPTIVQRRFLSRLIIFATGCKRLRLFWQISTRGKSFIVNVMSGLNSSVGGSAGRVPRRRRQA